MYLTTLVVCLLVTSQTIFTVSAWWHCDFEEFDCHAKYEYRTQANGVKTRYWNRINYETASSVTSKGHKTGPASNGNYFMYFESTPAYGKHSSKGYVKFMVPAAGRTDILLTFRYHAFGNDADLEDFDLLVIGVMSGGHYDLKKISKNQMQWHYFKQRIQLKPDTETFYLKFTARSRGFLADYAIDDINVADYDGSGEIVNDPCNSASCEDDQYCNFNGTCVDKCTLVTCGTGAGCEAGKTKYSMARCACDEGKHQVFDDYMNPLSCVAVTMKKCDFEYPHKTSYCEINVDSNNPSVVQGYTHPSSWHGPYNAISGYGYKKIVNSINDTNIFYIPTDGTEEKVALFYGYNDKYAYIKSASVGGHNIFIHRDYANKWLLLEVPAVRANMSFIVDYILPGAKLVIDNIVVTGHDVDIVNKDFNGKTCKTYGTTAPPSIMIGDDDVQLLHAMLVVDNGIRKCVCKPGYQIYSNGNDMYCREMMGGDVVVEVPVCTRNAQCTGANVQCIDGMCDCKPGYYRDGSPLQSTHSCSPYPCTNSPCDVTAICSNVDPYGALNYNCSCPDGTMDVSDDDGPSNHNAKCKPNGTKDYDYVCNDPAQSDLVSCNGSITINKYATGLGFDIETFRRRVNGEEGAPGDDTIVYEYLLSRGNTLRNILPGIPGGIAPIPLTTIDFNIGLTASYVACSFFYQSPVDLNTYAKSELHTYAGDQITLPDTAGAWDELFYVFSNPSNKAFNFSFAMNFTADDLPSEDSNKMVRYDIIKCKGFERMEQCDECTDGSSTCNNLASADFECLCPDKSSLGSRSDKCPDPSLPTRLINGTTVGCSNCEANNEECDYTTCKCARGFKRIDNKFCAADTSCGASCDLCVGGKCMCGEGKVLDHASVECMEGARVCAHNCDLLGEGGVCDNTTGYCKCMYGYFKAKRDDGTYHCDKNGEVGTPMPDPNGHCSVTCGDGKIDNVLNCTAPVGTGYPCYSEETDFGMSDCNNRDCPVAGDQCPIQKPCSCDGAFMHYARGTTPSFNGFDHPENLDKLFKIETKWNKDELDQKCKDAACEANGLNFLKQSIQDDYNWVNKLEHTLNTAIAKAEILLNCHPSGDDHNESFWDAYDKLIELSAYRKHAAADLVFKKSLVENEEDRCKSRTDMHKLLDGLW